jgi:Protein of unknown function (DUF3120)
VLSSPPESRVLLPLVEPSSPLAKAQSIPQNWQVFAAAVFLVSVPVFFEAPLVRYLPEASLVGTLLWFGAGLFLKRNPKLALWGELLVGFSWTWMAGSLYWGWLRMDPMLHLPVEAIALPIALIGLQRNWCRVGQSFYLGSLFGTIVTDLYFHVVGLIPAWKQIMLNPSESALVLQSALTLVYTPWGLAWAAILTMVLLFVASVGLVGRRVEWLAFSGAVLSTLLVDGLFWLAAVLA